LGQPWHRLVNRVAVAWLVSGKEVQESGDGPRAWSLTREHGLNKEDKVMTEIFEEIRQVLIEYLPNLIKALLILVIGSLVALAIAAIVRWLLKRTRLDVRVALWAGTEALDTSAKIGRGVFYLLMIAVLVGFFQALHVPLVSDAAQALRQWVTDVVPGIVQGALLLLVAWIIASFLRWLVRIGLQATRLDEKFGASAGLAEPGKISLSGSLANFIFWFVLLLFLPAVLSALNMRGLVEPVQGMLTKVLEVVPRIFAASVLLIVGWFIARVLRQVVSNLLTAAGADQLGESVGISAAAGQWALSGILGTIVYALVLIGAIIAALQALQIEAISGPATQMLTTVLKTVPTLFAAILVLAIAYVVGRVVAGLATNILTGIGFNRLPARLGLGQEPVEGQRTPSDVAGYVVLVAAMVVAAMEASNLLGLTMLADLVRQFITFAGQLFVALVIFVIGFYLANLTHGAIVSARGAQAGLGAEIARIAIVVLAAAMALTHVGLAKEVVMLTFGLILGAACVAVAIAFGLGSRELAQREVEKWVETLKKPKT